MIISETLNVSGIDLRENINQSELKKIRVEVKAICFDEIFAMSL